MSVNTPSSDEPSVKASSTQSLPASTAPTKKRGLGRGLDALLAGAGPEIAGNAGTARQSDGVRLHAQLLVPGPWQPRRILDPDALAELADSIRRQGLMQPVVVRPAAAGQYEIIAGERRWRACQQAGLEQIPVIIREVSDEDATIMALIENIQRENLNPIEEAQALGRLQREGGLTQLQLAEAVGKSRPAVANLLRLLKLTTAVQMLVEQGELEMGHARALLPLADDVQLELAQEAVKRGMTVRELEQRVRQQLSADDPATTVAEPVALDSAQAALEKQALLLSEKYAAQVSIKNSASGKGRIVLAYDSPAELEKLLQQLN